MKNTEVPYKKATDVIHKVANKMKKPEYVKEICNKKHNYIFVDKGSANQWSELSLINGYPALGVLFGELNQVFPKEEWDLIGHRYMIKIQESVEKNGIESLTFFSGACSVGMAAYALSCNGKRYNNFLNTINEFILEQCPSILKVITLQHNDVFMWDYDVISGVCGLGRYLLFFKQEPIVNNIIKDILKYLVSLTEDINVFGYSVPKFYISRKNQFLKSERDMYTKGNFNFGISHGITGPLAFMSIALLNGIEIKGQKTAIRKIVSILNTFKYTNNKIIYWPGRVNFDNFVHKKIQVNNRRASWCYGVPGIARAIYLAGKALKDDTYKNIAIEAFNTLCSLKEEELELTSPTFCHGYAGLLQILNCMYNDTGLENLKEYKNKILNKILDFYHETTAFGFHNIDISNYITMSDIKNFDNCGLLSGSSGVVLSILGAIKPSTVQWDSIFMIN
ncbi:lanthionine synthetase C family protein [Clostridium hydrogenum]|uniref:lanthionine synthetase C family protein n=1 Tax=Clostridium hydrogenum TaxID=2855764 RepID=UPI001F19008A|nr:lanthionine synthetase C family protein [Clostridium hydrogenum]